MQDPLNSDPRIRLIDCNEELIMMISQNQAGRLINRGHANLSFSYPVTVKFVSTKNEWADNMMSRVRKSSEVLSGAPYANIRVQRKDGNEIFHCSYKKALWYMNRGKVDIVSQDPPTLRLNFECNGEGNLNDVYYLTPKKNICVVCGSKKRLTKHHILPVMFRKYMQDSIKNHKYLDILPVCHKCHKTYEIVANELKNEIAAAHGLTVDDSHAHVYLKDNNRVKNLASALIQYGDKIPQDRKDYIYQVFKDFSGKEEITPKDVEEFSKLTIYQDKENYKEVGQIIIEQTDDLQAFAEKWRKHFIDVMKPLYMPEHWDIYRPL